MVVAVCRKEIPFPKEDSESKILLSKVRSSSALPPQFLPSELRFDSSDV